MPTQYLLLIQLPNNPCQVVFYDSDKQTREVKFSGKRWDARRYLRDLRLSVGWENIPAFCEKSSRNGYSATVREIPLNSL